MRAMRPVPFSATAALALVGIVLLASGCRTYGKRGATAKMLNELKQSVQLFASDLDRARAAHDRLRQAAEGDSALRLVAEEYDTAVAGHEAILENNRDLVARFEDDLPDYRTMERAFGAALSNHQIARNRYRSLRKAVRYPGATARLGSGRGLRGRAAPDSLPRVRDEAYTEGRYYIAPIFYERLQSAGNDMTMRQALAERRQRQSQSSRLAPSQSGEGSSLPTGPASPADSSGRTAP